MKTGAIILSLLAATGLAAPMVSLLCPNIHLSPFTAMLMALEEQAQQANDAQMMDQVKMMQQAETAVNGLFDPPRNGNGNIIADIFDTASCIFGALLGSHACQPSNTIVHVTGDDHHSDNSNASVSTSSSYQYTYSTDSDGNYHIQINPGGNKSNCNYTVSKDDAGALANTINQLATKCLSN